MIFHFFGKIKLNQELTRGSPNILGRPYRKSREASLFQTYIKNNTLFTYWLAIISYKLLILALAEFLTYLVKASAYLNAIKRGEKQFGELARFESDCASHTDDGDLGKG